LDAVNLKIEPGDRVCIDGPGACGKSSLLSVIAGLEFPDRGTVLMDGLPMGNLQLPAMRTIMGDSLGQEDLFEGTLLENISLGREGVDLDAVRWAMERVGLGDWIGSLSRGLDTPISAGGSGLARTVVRRIILARSIAHKPRIVVLDDFLEAFGPEERALLLDACTGTDVPWTLVAVSHDREFRERATVHVEMQRGRVKVNRQAPSPFKSGI
jgi:ABC-type bacteriocin/lantibiotic exporter with double-glycine peptidase domain